ncbi:MAG: efflux RND transporter periplasmic adaptor subunit [Phycisphaerae bacterium]
MRALYIAGARGWVWVITVLILVSGAAFVAGSWLTVGGAANAPASNKDDSGDPDILYTCGMHPQILEPKPGLCPICQMKLTPYKVDSEDDTDQPTGPEERKVLYWRAPMDPNYISEKPGKSPMGMDLVPVYADTGETLSGNLIRIDPVTIQNMGVRTERVRRGPLAKIIRTLGRVDYDEQRVVYVDTKISGWIEELYVDETGQQVKKGDPLFAVYSPELYSAQIEYVQSLHRLPMLEASTSASTAADARAMVEAARNKLTFFDVSEAQIDLLKQTGKTEKNIKIYSPADGVVTDKMATEGMQIRPGMRFYTIADLSRVWVYVDIYEYQIPWIHVGQKASMTLPYVPGKVFRGDVVYIYPYVQKETRVIKVRLEFDNPTLELKPDMFANVMLESNLRDDAVLVPREAYIDSGTRKLVFVDRGRGKFEPRDIQVGVEGEGGKVEVLLGLEAGDVVVTSGQFMLDTESKLKEAVAKMLEAKRAPVKKPTQVRTAQAAEEGGEKQAGASGIPEDAAYACPMDTHPDESDPAKRGPYFAAEPGDCPLCGMKLKPIDDLQWVQAMKSAAGADVGYTCVDHPHVFSEHPGVCPRCDRTLEPFKAIYTCRKPEHAGVISTVAGDCPHCLDPLVAFRGPWLSDELAAKNQPSEPALAATAGFHCKAHPLVHSDKPGVCTICAASLVGGAPAVAVASKPRLEIPHGAKYVCPMEECLHFSESQGQCPKCGMKLKPIEDVAWAAALARPVVATGQYVCPMHPQEVRQDHPGTCRICAMQLVSAGAIVGQETGPAPVRRQIDFIIEHYLALQTLLAADKKTDIARNALGVVDATEVLANLLENKTDADSMALSTAARQAHKAALKITGVEISSDRAHFSDLSSAMRKFLAHVRPDQKRWPKLYIFHCPMSKADWVQTSKKKANPYYGFKMLDCGKLVETK